jgi:adenylate kinase
MVAIGEAVLLTGAYGTGKTSVCQELAERLESAGVAYGAIDLDWLGWFNAPQLDAAAQRTYLDNLSAVATNYADAGVQRLVLAGAVRSNVVLVATRTVIRFPSRVVRLTVPLHEIERRLSNAVTVGRARDMRNATRCIERGIGADVGNVVIANDRPIRDVADQIRSS